MGLALQGTLANIAGGGLILLFKSYVVGNIIESQGKSGEVREIQIFNTILVTPQGNTIILPNGAMSNNVIVNKTVQNKVIVEIHRPRFPVRLGRAAIAGRRVGAAEFGPASSHHRAQARSDYGGFLGLHLA